MNWQQLQTVLWLRWKLSLNQLKRGSSLNLVFGMLALIGGYCLAFGGIVAGFFLGWKVAGPGPTEMLTLIWDLAAILFLFLWTFGMLAELQRSELIDLQRLLHLPVALPQLFLINYVASHLSMSILFAGPAMMALSIGIAVYRGPLMLLLLPLVAGFLLMITAWSYYLRGWLASIMVNQRRRRSIMVAITVGIMLLAQAPNIYFNVFRGARSRNRPNRQANINPAELLNTPTMRAAHWFFPPLWLPNGARGLAEGNALPALAGTLGLWLLAACGLGLSYRSTLRFYLGVEKPSRARRPALQPSLSASPKAEAPRAGPLKNFWMERTIPGIAGDTSALALASFRSMLRAPEMKMVLVSPIIMLIVFGALFASKSSTPLLPQFRALLPTGMICFLFFGMLQLLLNQFGFDRNAFRALVLLPTPRRDILLAKNLAFAPFLIVPAGIILLVLTVLSSISILTLIAAFFQLVAMFLLVCTLGNVFSIGVPFRINPGTMKPTKQSPKTVALLLLAHFGFPLLAIPIFVPPVAELIAHQFEFLPRVPINFLLSIPLAGLMLGVYHLSLDELGKWLQRREREILLVVTQEVE